MSRFYITGNGRSAVRLSEVQTVEIDKDEGSNLFKVDFVLRGGVVVKDKLKRVNLDIILEWLTHPEHDIQITLSSRDLGFAYKVAGRERNGDINDNLRSAS